MRIRSKESALQIEMSLWAGDGADSGVLTSQELAGTEEQWKLSLHPCQLCEDNLTVSWDSQNSSTQHRCVHSLYTVCCVT